MNKGPEKADLKRWSEPPSSLLLEGKTFKLRGVLKDKSTKLIQ